MNKYHHILNKILTDGRRQENRKGGIIYLLNERLSLLPGDLLDIFEGHGIARKKLKTELSLFMSGERSVERYREAGINWWDYCGQTLVNSYPTYFEKLPPTYCQDQQGEAQQQELCAVPRFHGCREQSGSVPQSGAVPDRRR